MGNSDFYGEADIWHMAFSLPAPESIAFYLKLLPVLLKNRARKFGEKTLKHKVFPQWPFLEIIIIHNHDSYP